MNESRLHQTLRSIDSHNQQDPNTTIVNGQPVANERLYSQRMTKCLNAFAPDASELLQVAVHAQHIMRWQIPRSDYPMDRTGYKKWRTDLAAFHGQTTAKIMAEQGYSDAEQQRIKDILLKKQLKTDNDVQTLEDVACLVFLEHYLAAFAEKHSDDKLRDIIRKTWNKMSEAGHKAALNLQLPSDLLTLVTQALEEK